uniref:Endonuclease NucS C-terminal domain-containing protein n=1 Tax=mine drainage metagenome TaxID=410659 RepID=E6Q0S2_9ZZZZ
MGGQKPDAGKGSNPGRRSHTTGNSNASCDRTSDSISCRSMNLGIFPSNEKRPTCSFRLFRAGTNDKASRLVRISRLPIGRISFPIRWQRPPLSIVSCTMARSLSSLAKASGSRPASGTGKRPITAKSSLLGVNFPVSKRGQFLASVTTDGKRFALENHLRDFLAKDVTFIEPGMRLFTEIEGIDGVEVPMGGNRAADLLLIDGSGSLVVVELKVSRGHEKTVGQLLRYIGFAKREYAKGRKVRGVIVASEISNDLRLAVEPLKDALDVRLMRYTLKFEMTIAS